MASAADVPYKFDIIVNGEGYVFADADAQKAIMGYTSPFIARTALQGSAYGDSETEFFQVFAQKDWSKGEQQKFQGCDDDGVSRFWRGTAIDVSEPGRAAMRQATGSQTLGAAAKACANNFVATTTNLVEFTSSGSTTDRGAHGLGASPSTNGVEIDGTDVFLTTTAGGTVGVRKWDGGAFSTFSASPADSLAFLNNTLYGMREDTSKLVRYDTAGVQSDIFQWKQADGAARGGSVGPIRAFGGKLLIVWPSGPYGSELWLYDGTAPAMVAVFPPNFVAHSLNIAQGQVFVGGVLAETGSTKRYRPAIYFYAGGLIGQLWQADSTLTSANIPSAAVVGFLDGLVFNDDTSGRLLYYNATNGGVSGVGTYTVAGSIPLLSSFAALLIHIRNQTTTYYFPTDTTATSSTLTTSLIDFDSSLTKRFRSIEVEWDDDAADSGATVDVAYRVGDVDGSYTTLATGVTSGVENLLTNINGKSISVKVTLNKSGSTSGPTLKRIKVRAVPVRPSFRVDTVLINCQGRDGNNIRLRDQSLHNKDGKTMAQDLRTAATATNPITVIDTFGTYTAVIDPLELTQVRPEEYLARVKFREV